jgi:hypothetical protein
MANEEPNKTRPGNILDIGDTNSGDIVDRTGEQMPSQSHDGLEGQRDADGRSVRVNDEDKDAPVRRSPDSDTSAGRHDNPRTGRISDW